MRQSADQIALRSHASGTGHGTGHNVGRTPRRISGLGAYVLALMAKRRMNQQRELLHRLQRVHFYPRQQNLSNWFHGTQPPLGYIQAVVTGLELDWEEECMLYKKFVWESHS